VERRVEKGAMSHILWPLAASLLPARSNSRRVCASALKSQRLLDGDGDDDDPSLPTFHFHYYLFQSS